MCNCKCIDKHCIGLYLLSCTFLSQMNGVLASTNECNGHCTHTIVKSNVIHLNRDQNYTGLFSCINFDIVSLEFVNQQS